MGNFYYTPALYHHGIKGQRWGKRNGPPYPLDSNRKYGKVLGQDRNQDIHIKKGTSAYRVQGSDKEKEGQVFVSFDKLDHMKYLSCAAADVESGLAIDAQLVEDNETGLHGKQAYSVTMRLTEDILAPSYNATMDAFVNTIDSMGKRGLLKDAQDSFGLTKEGGKKFVNKFKDMSTDELRETAYLEFVSRFTKDSKAKSIFLSTLKEKGYNAIIDEFDAKFGNDGYTKSPVMIFDNSSVKRTASSQISKEDVRYFYNLYYAVDANSVSESTVNKWNNWTGTDLQKTMAKEGAVH